MPSATEAALALVPPPCGGSGRMRATARNAAENVAASIQYTVARPKRPNRRPATAGPAVRPTWSWNCQRA